MDYTKHLESPDVFHLWTAVGTIAGALRGKVWVDMGYWHWKPNFFIIFVAPAGIISKSTTMGVGIDMLREVEGIKFGPDSATWQALTDAFVEAQETVTVPGGKTVNVAPITIAASDLGTFRDPKNREMIDVLVDMWDGRRVPWKRRTKGEGETLIENPWFHFMGCTTPSWIEGNFPEYAIGGGFSSRTVFIYAEQKRQLVAYPKLQMEQYGNEYKMMRQRLIKDLQEIALIAGEYQLQRDAYKWGQEWYEKLWQRRPAHLAADIYSAYIARKQTHLHKIAMVLSAAQRNETIINANDLQLADALLVKAEAQLPLVFARVADNREVKYAAAIVAACRRSPAGLTRQQLWQQVFSQMSYTDFENAVTGAFAAGYIRAVGQGTAIRYFPAHQSHGKAEGTLPPEGAPPPSTGDSAT